MAKSDKARLALLLHYSGKAGDFGSAAAVFCRLWKVLPGLDGSGGVEVVGGSYAAVSCAGSFPTALSGALLVANDALVTFPTPTADWATGADRVVGFTLSSASTGTTTFSVVQALDDPVEVLNGIPFEFAIGALAFQEA